MKWLSEKITEYIIKTGAVSKELYAVYQYGFQIDLEMMSCLISLFIIRVKPRKWDIFYIEDACFIGIYVINLN